MTALEVYNIANPIHERKLNKVKDRYKKVIEYHIKRCAKNGALNTQLSIKKKRSSNFWNGFHQFMEELNKSGFRTSWQNYSYDDYIYKILDTNFHILYISWAYPPELTAKTVEEPKKTFWQKLFN